MAGSLAPGRIVRYIGKGSVLSGVETKSEEWDSLPAIIVHVHNQPDQEADVTNTVLDLQVFHRGQGAIFVEQVPMGGRPGHWQWPEIGK